jgi:hypothetical protein
LKYPHELVDLGFQSIEIASVELIVLIIHEILEDRVASIGIICQFQDVLAEVVHPL